MTAHVWVIEQNHKDDGFGWLPKALFFTATDATENMDWYVEHDAGYEYRIRKYVREDET